MVRISDNCGIVLVTTQLYINQEYKLIINNTSDMDTNQVITKRLDSLPFSRWHLGMILAIGTIWIFDGYQVSLVSLFSKYILNDHSQTQYKSLATLYQVGCIIGSVCFGILAYYFGRRPVFMITLLIYAIGVILCLLGNIFPLFLMGRLLTGISVGGQFTAIFTAVDQFLPPKVRGRVDIAIDGTWHLGGCLASIINLALGQTDDWRYLFSIGFFGVLGLACIRRTIPESPRWLIMKNRHIQAQNIVSGIQYSALNQNFFFVGTTQLKRLQIKSGNTDRDPKMKEIQNKDQQQGRKQQDQMQIQEGEGEYFQTSANSNKHNNIFTEIKIVFRQYKVRFLVSCFLIYVQAFFFNSVYYKYPIVLKNTFDLAQRQISGYMLGLSVCSFVSTLLIGPFFDICGRKKMLLITYCATGILLPFSNLIKSDSIGLQVLTCLMFMFGSPASSSANLIASQIFPTSTRPIILSLIFVVGMFGGMCGVWTDNYYVSAILMILGGILGFLLCPNAENKSLQQINKHQEELSQ